jgi:hypothetical protein
LEYLPTCHAVLGMLSLTFRLLCLIDTLRAAPRHSESAAKWILMVLWVPNVAIRDAKAFWWCRVATICIWQEIIQEINLGQNLFGSLLQLHDGMHCWKFARIIPTATMKLVDKSRINETYSLMKFSILSLSLSLLHDLKSTCIGVRESM